MTFLPAPGPPARGQLTKGDHHHGKNVGVSDRIGVMYYGKLVELADSDELFEHPLHPYTKSLLSAIPYPDPHHEKHRQRIEYKPLKEHDYSVNKPSLREIKPGHFINCNDEEFERYKKELGL